MKNRRISIYSAKEHRKAIKPQIRYAYIITRVPSKLGDPSRAVIRLPADRA